MVVVVSSVKNYFAKKNALDSSDRSAFYSLPLCFSPLTFASFEFSLSLTYFFKFRSLRVGGRSLAFILIGPFVGSSSLST
jgi:hypothetical protein